MIRQEIEIEPVQSNQVINNGEKNVRGSTHHLFKAPPKQDYTTNFAKLIIVIVISFVFIAGQFVGGYISNSISVISDAFHLVTDLIGFVIAFIFICFSRKIPNDVISFGYHRMQIIGALGNLFIIWALAAFLIYEATMRIIEKEFVQEPLAMLIVASAGLVVNIIMYFVLHTGGHSHGLMSEPCSHDHGEVVDKYKCCTGQSCDDDECLKLWAYQQHCHVKIGSENEIHIHKIVKRKQSQDQNQNAINSGKELVHQNEEVKLAKLKEKFRIHQHNQKCQPKKDSNHQHSKKCNHKNDQNQQNKNIHSNLTDQVFNGQNIKNQQNGHQCQHQHKHQHKHQHQHKNQHKNQHKHQHGNCNGHHGHQNGNQHAKQHKHQHQQIQHQGGQSISMKAAILHALSDVIQSIGLLISSLIIYFAGSNGGARVEQFNDWHYLDPISTYIFSTIVILSTFPITKSCYYLIMEATPLDIELSEVQKEFQAVQGVLDIHDLHIWELRPGKRLLVCHAFAKLGKEREVLRQLTILCRKKKIYHSTIQVEQEQCKDQQQYIKCENDIH